MANLIQIKRSLNTATAPSLANGELAFTANGDHLFIGSNGSSITIAGKFNPGVLTANQALVANGTGYLDAVKTDVLTVRAITANGVTSPGADYLLSVDSNGNTYWKSQGAVSINTSAQYTWTNSHSFTANVASSNTTSGTIVITGGLGVSGRINTGDLAAGNTTVYSALTGTTLTTVNVFATSTVNAAVLSVGGWVIANNGGVYTSGIVNADILAVGSNFRANTTQVTIASGVGLSANGSLGTANQVLRSNGTSIYWDTDAGDISSVVAGNGLTGGGTNGDVTLNVVGANGINVTADAVGLTTGSTLTVNSAGVHVNTNLALTSLSLTGDLTVAGNLTTTNVSSVIVSDPLIYLAGNNYTSDLVDIGFAGNYNNGTNRHTGLFRDATDGVYKLFFNLTQELDAAVTVNTADPTFSIATLQAYLNSGALTTNATNLAITANSTVGVSITANSLTLSTPLAVSSGGLGLSSITSGAILVGNGSGTATVLAAATNGYVLQSNGTSVVYGTLDGGTF